MYDSVRVTQAVERSTLSLRSISSLPLSKAKRHAESGIDRVFVGLGGVERHVIDGEVVKRQVAIGRAQVDGERGSEPDREAAAPTEGIDAVVEAQRADHGQSMRRFAESANVALDEGVNASDGRKRDAW